MTSLPSKAPSAPPLRQTRATLFMTLAVLTAIVLAYAFVDRQLATLLRPHLSGVKAMVWLTMPAKPLTPAASVIAAFLGLKVIFTGRRLSPFEIKLLAFASGILVAGVFTFELKEVFGRTWPETWTNNNPSYFGDGTYGFFFFHGGRGWNAFPSGHMTAIGAFAGGLWCLWPRLRAFAVVAAIAVAAGLLGANYHWLSDIIAGAAVGVMTAYAAARIGRATLGSSGAGNDDSDADEDEDDAEPSRARDLLAQDEMRQHRHGNQA